MSTDGGASWHPAERPTVSSPEHWGGTVIHFGLSCSASYCVAPGSPPAQSTDGGRHWALVLPNPGSDFPVAAMGADCFAVDSCLLLGYRRDAAGAAKVMVTHDRGAHWVQAQLPAGRWSLDSAFCTGHQRCIAVGSQGTSASAKAAVLSSADGGLSWHRRSTFDAASSLSEITCPAPSTCLATGPPSVPPKAAGAFSLPAPVLFWTGDDGRTWQRGTMPAPTGSNPSIMQISSAELACSAQLCIAVLSSTVLFGPSHYVVLSSSDYGTTWARHLSPRSLGSVAAGADIQALTCNRAAVCVAVGDGDEGGVIFYSHDGGRSWAAAHGSHGGLPWT